MAILDIQFFSHCLLRDVRVKAIVPVDKFDIFGASVGTDKPFKTLYLLHGIYGNENSWFSESRISKFASDKDLVVIMPAGENKFYVNNPNGCERYGEFIGKELVEITRKMFKLSEKREDTFIAGLSMGGYGAMHNGLKYCDTFGYIATLSAALIVDEEIVNSDDSAPVFTFCRKYYESIFGDLDKVLGSELDTYAQIDNAVKDGVNLPQIYMCIGTEDFLYSKNIAFRDYLVKLGVEVTFEEFSGIHDWDFWDSHIQDVLNWLPLEDGIAGVGDGNVIKQ